MDTVAARASRIALMLIFALSCIGLLVFLWIQFGGSVPTAARGYRINVEFAQATELGTQDDVEIAGVPIGSVVAVSPDRRTGLTRAVLQINAADAPRPADTRAILREKSLLGETYVELTPGDPRGPMLVDGATLPHAQVAPTVSLDEILNTFSPPTRAAFETWMQDGGMALSHRGEAFNAALGELAPFGSDVNAVLQVLERDTGSARTLLSDGAGVLSALAAQPSQLQNLVNNTDAVFAVTDRRAASLAAAVQAFPAFLTTATAAVAQLSRFSADSQPLLDTLDTAAPDFSAALVAIARLAPNLRTALVALAPVTRASVRGIPALQSFLTTSVPLLRRASPYLAGVVPILDYLDRYRQALAGFLANVTASTQGSGQSLTSSALSHYVRIASPVNPESLTAYSARPDSNRSNPYMAPGGYRQLPEGLETFGRYLCTSEPLPTIGDQVPAGLAAVLSSVYFTHDPAGPACRPQTSLGLTMSYPQLQPLK